MVEIRRGVVDSPGTLLRGDIIAEDQIQFQQLSVHPRNGGNGIVGGAVGLAEDKCLPIRVMPPA